MDVRAQMRQMALAERGKADAKPIDDFGFNYPLQVVWDCFVAHKLHHHLPEAGGVLDQDPLLWDDIMTMYRLYNEEAEKVAPAPKPTTGGFSTEDMLHGSKS